MNLSHSNLSESGEGNTPAKSKTSPIHLPAVWQTHSLLWVSNQVRCQLKNTTLGMMMNKKTFSKFLDRDKCCSHCGTTDDTLIPQHRKNRGMGGSKDLDRPSNIIVLCSEANGLLESNSKFAELGRKFGWKLERWQEPESTPVYMGNGWFLLDNEYNTHEVEHDIEYF